MRLPLISVIVPVYKVEKYLAKCVDSILNQTYANLEIILVDDGSPDNCGKICDDYATKDSRVKVIHKENAGQSDARNAALDIMTGEYVNFVDSDDYIANDFIENLYKMIEQTGAQISLTAMKPFCEYEIPTKENFSNYHVEILDCDTALSQMFYQKRFDTCPQTKLYKADLFQGIRYPKGLIFEDLGTIYKVMLRANRLSLSAYRGYFYLLRGDSTEGSFFKSLKYESCIKIINQLLSDRAEMPPKSKKALNSRIVSFAFHILIQIPKDNAEMRKTLFEYVKTNRKGVPFDFNARRKTQVAAILSYGGMNLIDLFKKYGVSR